MTYNNFHQSAAPSFGSRGKGSHLRNISVPAPNSLAAPENQPVPTPRSARSALLMNLRTAPKTPTPQTTPASAPEHGGYDNSRYAGITAPLSGYGNGNHHHLHQQLHQRLPTPPSSSSPSIQVNDGDIDDYDHESYQQMQMMMAQNAYLAQVQQQLAAAQKVQQLQQQLAQLQMQGVGYSATPPMSPGMVLGGGGGGGSSGGGGVYGFGPSALYSQYTSPQYGQLHTSYSQQQEQLQQLQKLQFQHLQVQQLAQQQQQQQQHQQQQQQQQRQQLQLQLQQLQYQQQPVAQVEISPPTPIDPPASNGSLSMAGSRDSSRSRSPPKLNLHQSSNSNASSVGAGGGAGGSAGGAGAGGSGAAAANSSAAAGFRRGHRKASSLSTCTSVNNIEIVEAPRTSLPNLSQLPSTPMTATFAPGHASGTHPLRQPKGPPSFEELKAKPTSKHEGSKNFATRQRRRAISRLVSASTERRSARSASGTASAGGTMTPVSEHDGFAFEEETESVGSAAGRNSRQSLRDYDLNNSSADEGSVSSRPSSGKSGNSGLRTPSLAPGATDKRKSALF